jgi:tetratricopeptide (TPR) repeat protein
MTSPVADESTPSLADQVHEANRQLRAGDTEGALAILRSVTSDGHIYVPAQFLLSMTAWKLGRFDWSIELMRQCHEAEPMDGTVAEILASLYAQAGDLQESLFMGKLATALGGPGELRELIPGGFPTFDYAFYTIKENPMLAGAKAKLAEGKLDEAIEKARQHVAFHPTDGDTRGFLADLLLRAGRAGAAVDVMRAIEGHIVGGGEFPAHYASLYARALAAVGDARAARTWHEKSVAGAPDDAAVAAAWIADGAWVARDAAELAEAGDDWARRFCQTAKPKHWQRPSGKLVIGYLLPDFIDRADMAAVAAVARAHDRARVTVIGYGSGAQSWGTNLVFRGAFDTWHDVSALDPATLARFFARAGLHVIVDAAGFAAPRGLMALARVETAIRAAWLGNGAALGSPVYDVQIGAAPVLSDRATNWPAGAGYPIVAPAREPAVRIPGEVPIFGADVSMAQLDEDTVALWSSVLGAQHEATLLLYGNDMRAGQNIERLIDRFGRDLAARIDIVDETSIEDFYGLVDVALLPRRGASPRAAAQAMACGVPPVAVATTSIIEPYAPFLQDLGLGAILVAPDAARYASLALALAEPGPRRERAGAAIAKAAARNGARAMAQALERHAADMLQEIEDAVA